MPVRSGFSQAADGRLLSGGTFGRKREDSEGVRYRDLRNINGYEFIQHR